jgi:Transposase
MAVIEGVCRIVGGVDTHKDLHVAAIVDEQDRIIGTRSFATTRQGYRQMLAWMRSFGVLQRIGIESTGSYAPLSPPTFTIEKQIFEIACQLNGIDKATREAGTRVLRDAGRIDLTAEGSIAVLGATTQAVLEAAVEVFEDQGPTSDEEAILELSEHVSGRPVKRTEAEEYISDTHKLKKADVASLIDLSRSTALIDQEGEAGERILFNSHTFRDGKYAQKAPLE